MAHEINNPLGYLKSDVRSLDTLVARSLSSLDASTAADIRDITHGIDEGLGRIEKVVKSLLSYARQGSYSAPMEDFDLDQGVETTLEIMRFDLRSLVEIREELGDVPIIQARCNEINQVIMNILTNALHAIQQDVREGRPAAIITIRTGDSGTGVYCEIENNGPPIAPETASHLFNLYYTTSPEHWGTGQGLYICRSIVEGNHGGTLSLKSLDPVCFRIELPYGQRDATMVAKKP
jgi:signal transduction histidine kinase